MAGNANSGRNVRFPYSLEQLKAEIKQYKLDLQDGKFARPSWPHFCARLDLTEKDLEDLLALDRMEGCTSAYMPQVREIKKFLTWLRGELLSSSHWSGPASGKAIFALKQDLGDGVRYKDKQDQGQTGPTQVSITFGDGDKRGKDAFK